MHHLEPQARGGAHSRTNCLCLCSTHHGLLHEGLLRIEGDAEAELRFFDAQGKLITDPLAGGPGAVTQCGSSTGPRGSLSAEAAGVLQAMGGRGGWHPAGLCEASGLPVSAVSRGLIELELGGQARRTSYGYEAVT
ncbi:MAG: hypothetical protein HY744_32620 [Deltaproteobacteria bacterium]|nr:hypothetical protein [Deltaproteobacteria bacterium]